MFNAIIRLSIEYKGMVVLLAAGILAWGGWLAQQLPIDVFPDLNRPTVTLMTEAGGLSPEEVELLISRPVETAMNGAPGVERTRSQSAPGLSVVWVEFSWETDIFKARQQVAERISTLALPEMASPLMGPVSSIMGEILLVGISSPKLQGPTLRSLADWTIRPRLVTIPGISQVIAIGGGVEQLQIEVDPLALARYGISLEEVKAAAALAQGSSTGGFLERKSQEYMIRNLARTADADRIGDTVVASRSGTPILLRQLAEVKRGKQTMRGDAGVNGQPGVVLSIQKQPGSDTLSLTAAVEKALNELGPALGSNVQTTLLFRQADFIQASIANVKEALLHGALLVTVILILFLLNLRTTLITLTAIPLSFVVSALVLYAFGLSINTMTLGGLAVAIGELVDDAIVDVENVYRRLQENSRLVSPKPVLEVVFTASSEIRNSIVFSTILVVLVFLPLFSLSGMEGRLFAPLGIAYITSILASLLVSLSLTPALCSWLLPQALHTHKEIDGWLVRQLKHIDRRMLTLVLPHPALVVGTAGLLVVLALASVPFLGSSFLPPFNEGTATINLMAAPGTSLEESNRLGSLAERELLNIPEVASTGRRTGRAEADEHAEGVHYTEIDVDFYKEGRDRAIVLEEIRGALAILPGLSINIGQPISHRLDHLLSGVRAAIAIKIIGPDLHQLRSTGALLAQKLKNIPGLVDIALEPQTLVPQLQLQVKTEEARRFGVAPGWLTEELEEALAGVSVAEVYDGIKSLDLVVRYGERWRTDLEVLGMIPLVLPDGRAVPLKNLVELQTGTGPNQILHENASRRLVLSANTAGRDLGSIVKDIQTVLTNFPLPASTYFSLGGQFESQQQATRNLAVLSLFSILGMYLVLFTHFQSHLLTLQVLLNIPLALIGSVAALWISGQPVSVATLVGFITLCGIASRNTILMISHYLQLQQEGESGVALVIRGSLERLVPVSMTALCAGIGLLPLAFAGGQPGKEILTPVAQVILGGLVSSTLLDMVVTPTVFLYTHQKFLR